MSQKEIKKTIQSEFLVLKIVTNMKYTFEHYLEQVFGFVKKIKTCGREM